MFRRSQKKYCILAFSIFSMVSLFPTSCIYPMRFWNLPYLPPCSLVFLRSLPSFVSLTLLSLPRFWLPNLTSSPLVFLICIFLSFLASLCFSFTPPSYARPLFSLLPLTLCFLFPFPFTLHIFHRAEPNRNFLLYIEITQRLSLVFYLYPLSKINVQRLSATNEDRITEAI